jgi:pimeloyl-ACP methyl ester carboxylesterase
LGLAPHRSRRRGRKEDDLKPLLFAVGAAAAIATAISRRYRREMDAARARLAEVDRRVVQTDWGLVEYAERGGGEPLLVLHGIFGGCDSGLLGARDLSSDRRVLAPSRFGYLGSSLPPNATPADQADALAALLDALGLATVDVIGISAGATSALELALRHPSKVKHLAVVVGNLPGSPTAVVQPASAKVFDRQLPVWLLKTFFPRRMTRAAGVPETFSMTDDDARSVARFLESMFPLTPRRPGVLFDAFVSNAAVNSCNLEAITVPTLVIHTRDDVLASHDASKCAADRIPAARFVSLGSGGHLLLGQAKVIHDQLQDFFADRSPEQASDAEAKDSSMR